MRISVRDTGKGIAAEFLPHVFDRFRQADASSTRRHGGLGLGLALVRHLVELHGGSVSADSPGEGQGATFTVNLPLRAVRSVTDLAQDVPAAERRRYGFGVAETPSLAGLRVLVVDDQEEARELVTTVLEQAQAEVISAASAAETLAHLDPQTISPDVLVCDIAMPDEDGYHVLSRIRYLEAQRGVPFSARLPAIALTAYARQEDRMRALAAGFQMHIAKPVEPAELIVSVAALAAARCGTNCVP